MAASAIGRPRPPPRQHEQDPDMIDDTHSPGRRHWGASAHQHADFSIQNLPPAVCARRGVQPFAGVVGDGIRRDLRR